MSILKVLLDKHLDKVIRDKMGLSYDIEATITDLDNLIIFEINMAFSKNNKKDIINVLKKNITKFEIKKEEFNIVKNSLMKKIDFMIL